MTQILGPGFYSANRHTPYPFRAEYGDIVSRFIDASVSVRGSTIVGEDPQVTFLEVNGGSRDMELSTDSQVLLPRGTPITVQNFGAYELWYAENDKAQMTLVYQPDGQNFTFDQLPGDGLPMVEHTVTFGRSDEVFSILASALEVAGPGEALTLGMGAHLQATISGQEVTLSAIFDPDLVADAECGEESEPKTPPGIKSINGVFGDGDNNINILGGGTFIVDNAPPAKIKVINTGEACCDCEDYVALFETIRVTHDRLNEIRLWAISNRSLYSRFVNYVKFLLRTCVVGETPLDGTNIAECD